jgi:hypothetical protein
MIPSLDAESVYKLYRLGRRKVEIGRGEGRVLTPRLRRLNHLRYAGGKRGVCFQGRVM